MAPRRRPIGRPRRVRGHHQPGQREQHGVVVDPPARVVAPRLLPVGFDGYAGFGKPFVDLEKLRFADGYQYRFGIFKGLVSVSLWTVSLKLDIELWTGLIDVINQLQGQK